MKYDLETMLQEIKEDESLVLTSRKKQVSQKEIMELVEKRRKKAPRK